MSTETALGILEVNPPAMASAASYEEAQKILGSWHNGELKTAYRARCKARHPDLGPEEEQDQRESDMKEINTAYSVLKDTKVVDKRPRATMAAMAVHLGGVHIHINGGRIVIIQSVSKTST